MIAPWNRIASGGTVALNRLVSDSAVQSTQKHARASLAEVEILQPSPGNVTRSRPNQANCPILSRKWPVIR